jgi:GxxExxY protein
MTSHDYTEFMNHVNNKYYKSDITGTIIDCAQKVHRFLGNGFQEVIYQRALEIEFEKEKMKFEREREMDIFL